jgi:hypothetical protein
VILSIMGVLIGLMVFQMPFGVIMVGVGIISLAGVVVNNGIVLIDYTDILRERDGVEGRESLVRAGVTRWRPVMLTALTTAIGLVPMAIGLNLDFITLFTELDPQIFFGGDQAAWWGSMSVTVLVGVLAATFLTLLLVPVMVSLADDFGAFLRRTFVGEDEPRQHSGGGRREPIPEEEIPAWDTGLRPAGAKGAPVAVARSRLDAIDGLRPATE